MQFSVQDWPSHSVLPCQDWQRCMHCKNWCLLTNMPKKFRSRYRGRDCRMQTVRGEKKYCSAKLRVAHLASRLLKLTWLLLSLSCLPVYMSICFMETFFFTFRLFICSVVSCQLCFAHCVYGVYYRMCCSVFYFIPCSYTVSRLLYLFLFFLCRSYTLSKFCFTCYRLYGLRFYLDVSLPWKQFNLYASVHHY